MPPVVDKEREATAREGREGANRIMHNAALARIYLLTILRFFSRGRHQLRRGWEHLCL
jgi:hypothetical protein